MFNKIQDSIIFRIGTLLFAISALSIVGMFSSYVITDTSQTDAAAVNLSGSLRKQVYLISTELAIYQNELASGTANNSQRLDQAIELFEQKLNSNLLKGETGNKFDEQLMNFYQDIHRTWQSQIEPEIQEVIEQQASVADILPALHEFVISIDHLVTLYQQHAEDNLQLLRIIQVGALFLTFAIIFGAMRSISVHIEKPLKELTLMAKSIGNGDFTHRTHILANHELALLGKTFNSMCDSIAKIHGNLEQRVQNKTILLKRSNDALQLLFDASRAINETNSEEINFKPMLNQLAEITGLHDLDLCLTTPDGEKPYQHLMSDAEKAMPERCIEQDCRTCLFGSNKNKDVEIVEEKYPLSRESVNYGVLVCRMHDGQIIQEWQHQIIQSLAEQIAIALGIKNQKQQEKRFSLMQERTVIARELHDSLAQSLSYLKIQVARIQKAIDKNAKPEVTQSIIDELKEGLGSAYRQLRELLTTFRLRVDEQGVVKSLENTIQLLTERSDIIVNLDCEIENVPLQADEEIHLLQIAKEATQNAVYHSKGQSVNVSLKAANDKSIRLTIEDDGIGISDDPEKLNHYGLAILKERSRNLQGDIEIKRLSPKGTGVYFSFTPKYVSGF